MKISNVNLYMVDPDRPDHGDLSDSPAGTTVAVMDHGWGVVQVAEELWRLVDPERADRLAAWQRRANAQDLRLGADEIRELLELLEGLPEAIVGPVVSTKGWLLAPEQLAGLRERAPTIFDVERPIGDELHAIAEALHAVDALRTFFERAKAARYEVIA
jgi:hypothetical protein